MNSWCEGLNDDILSDPSTELYDELKHSDNLHKVVLTSKCSLSLHWEKHHKSFSFSGLYMWQTLRQTSTGFSQVQMTTRVDFGTWQMPRWLTPTRNTRTTFAVVSQAS